ncbi:MAG: hypothetical protein KDC54_14570, partial [Lewinella sp.]|nr:hypothetical protein [Lewinella sp.]
MKYELKHDSLALQIFQKSSKEAHTRRKIERYIRERFEGYQARGVMLSQDDIDYIKPYQQTVNISDQEETY